MSWKVKIFIVGFKFKYFFSINKQITMSILMQTQKKFAFALVKLILNFFSGDPKLPLILKVGASPNIKFFFAIVRMR